MSSRAWVVTQDNCQWRWYSPFQCPLGLELLLHDLAFCWDENVVSMPSRAWVVTLASLIWLSSLQSFNALSGLSCYPTFQAVATLVGSFNALSGLSCYGLEMHHIFGGTAFQCPLGLELLPHRTLLVTNGEVVSMPSRAWVVTFFHSIVSTSNLCFNALSGLSCYIHKYFMVNAVKVSMPSRAWVVTSNIFTEPIRFYVSMPSRAWVVTVRSVIMEYFTAFQCPLGLELLLTQAIATLTDKQKFQCPLGLELLHALTKYNAETGLAFQCPLGLELLRQECPIF